METHTQEQGSSYLPMKLLMELRHVKRDYTQNILTSIKRHGHFISKGQRKKERKMKSIAHSKNNITQIHFSPFAMTLGHGTAIAKQSQVRSRCAPNLTPHPIAQPNQLVSVFDIAIIASDPELFVLQKVQRKSAPGFSGGGIEQSETILAAAAREFREESRGKEQLAGVDISRYNPVCIGTFTLDRATIGEQGAVVVVEIPEEEMANIVAGGGDQEGEVVEKIYFLTFEEMTEIMINGPILANSKKIWQTYLEHLVS